MQEGKEVGRLNSSLLLWRIRTSCTESCNCNSGAVLVRNWRDWPLVGLQSGRYGSQMKRRTIDWWAALWFDIFCRIISSWSEELKLLLSWVFYCTSAIELLRLGPRGWKLNSCRYCILLVYWIGSAVTVWNGWDLLRSIEVFIDWLEFWSDATLRMDCWFDIRFWMS